MLLGVAAARETRRRTIEDEGFAVQDCAEQQQSAARRYRSFPCSHANERGPRSLMRGGGLVGVPLISCGSTLFAAAAAAVAEAAGLLFLSSRVSGHTAVKKGKEKTRGCCCCCCMRRKTESWKQRGLSLCGQSRRDGCTSPQDTEEENRLLVLLLRKQQELLFLFRASCCYVAAPAGRGSGLEKDVLFRIKEEINIDCLLNLL